jgi:hypothetical protein
MARRENTERLNLIDLLERGGQQLSPLLAHDPLHSMRPAHDVNLQTTVQEVTSKVGDRVERSAGAAD